MEVVLSANNIILDCDPGHDDALAILLALSSPKEINCLGITTSAGNVPLELTTKNALRVLALIKNNNIEVYKGCPKPLIGELVTAENVHGESGLDTGSGTSLPEPISRYNDKHAVNFILDTLKEAPNNDITLVATGPLTNLAAAFSIDPQTFRRAKRIVLMGGAGFEPGNITPAAEFNIYVDPFAAKSIFQSELEIFMFGLDVTHKMIITSSRLKAIKSSSSLVGPAVADLLTFFNVYDTKKYGWDGAPLHDPCTIAWLILPEIFEVKKMSVEIETNNGPAYGRTIADWFNVTSKKKNINVAVNGNSDRFFELITERLNFFDE